MGEGVEGSCFRCHTLELAHYQYSKNDPELLRSSQILKQQRNSFPDCRRNHHLTTYFSKVSTPCEGDTPHPLPPPTRSLPSLAHAMLQSFSLESFPLLSPLIHVRFPWCHGRWAEHWAKHDNVYLLSAVPLTNYTPPPDISHLGITIPCGVTAAIGIAFSDNKVACHVTDYAGQHASALVKTVF